MDNNGFTFTVPGSELLRVIKNALLFAGKDDTLPSLCAVRVELDNGTVTMVATDRFMLSAETVTVEASAGSGAFLLSRDDATNLTRVKAWNSDYLPVKVTYVPDDPEDAATGGKITFDAGISGNAGSFTYATVSGEYVRYRLLMEAPNGETMTEAVAFNPALLARLAKVNTGIKECPVILQTNGASLDTARRVTFIMGPNLRGVIMPVRTEMPATATAAPVAVAA